MCSQNFNKFYFPIKFLVPRIERIFIHGRGHNLFAVVSPRANPFFDLVNWTNWDIHKNSLGDFSNGVVITGELMRNFKISPCMCAKYLANFLNTQKSKA
jgi:hypothetical protein